MPATRPRFASSTAASTSRSLNGTTSHEVGDGLRDAGAGEHGVRALARAELVELVVVAHHHRVVVAVVAALDLDDHVTPGHRPHQVDGIHRRLGARVAEAPQGQPEALPEQLGHHDGVLGRLGEVGAERHPVAHRRHDRRVAVTGQHRAVAGVEVDVLAAVDVVHLRTRRRGSTTPWPAGRSASSTWPRRRGCRRPVASTPPSAAGGPGIVAPPPGSGRRWCAPAAPDNSLPSGHRRQRCHRSFTALRGPRRVHRRLSC